MRQVEKAVMLQTLDTEWRDHVTAMAYLRQGIQFRGYGQQELRIRPRIKPRFAHSIRNPGKSVRLRLAGG